MSGQQKNWDLKDINAFKQAFKLRTDPPSLFGKLFSPTPLTALAMYQQAATMLAKRRDRALNTRTAIEVKFPQDQWDATGKLIAVSEKLKSNTDSMLQQKPDEGAKDAAIDELTKLLAALTDEWIKIEASFLSARNIMTGGGDQAGMRKKLGEQAANLLGLAKEMGTTLTNLKTSSKTLTKLTGTIDDMVTSAGKDGIGIVNDIDFDNGLTKCRTELQRLSEVVSKLPDCPPDLLAKACKGLYGFETKSVAKDSKSEKPKIPFQNLLAAFAMVPADHALNSSLTKVVYEKLDGGGGDYNAGEKRIRIDPSLDLEKTEGYLNPETGKVEQVNSFSITTLHEIGHSVDAAYGIMSKHMGNDECGGWTEVDPLDYAPNSLSGFSTKLLQAVKNVPEVKNSLSDPAVITLFANYVTGGITAEEFCVKIKEKWESLIDDMQKQEASKLSAPINELTSGVNKYFLRDDHIEQSVKERYTDFEESFDGQLQTLSSCLPPMVKRDEFESKFLEVFKDKELAPAGRTDGKSLYDWVQNCYVKWFESQLLAAQTAKLQIDSWADEAKKCLPDQLDLKAYLAGASPWNTDLSDKKINNLAASHEAYKGDAKWWRYAKSARAGTSVTNYQWRAPGEWFAELYAITWFKRVEPPAGVGKAVRPYLFGGSIA